MLFFRRIEMANLPAITDLLHEAFPRRPLRYWVEGLDRLASLSVPTNCPRFGWMLESRGLPVGVILVIPTPSAEGSGAAIRCNVSSWYVKPEYRAYAPLLVLRAISNPSATYINASPADNTLPIIEAQGFSRFSRGVFAAVPALTGRRRAADISSRSEHWSSTSMSRSDRVLLADHRRFGCISLWCETADGGRPFIFRRRTLRFGRMPCAQLIYCRSLEDLERDGAAVGRFLAMKGLPVMLVAADRPLRGFVGRYFPGKLPMYFKGTTKPPIGDLAYTEAALFGF